MVKKYEVFIKNLQKNLQRTGICGTMTKLFRMQKSSRASFEMYLTDDGLRTNKIIKEVKIMREGIHPEYHQATVTCNCGNTFVTGSTKEDIHVEICSKCHPFYTGQQKAAQARGRVDKFNKKYGIQE